LNTSEDSEAAVQDVINSLRHSLLLNDKNMTYVSYYRRHGFMVRFGAISKKIIRSAIIGDMKNRFKNVHNNIVFNQKDSEKISRLDAERFQIITKEYDSLNRSAFSSDQAELLRLCDSTTVKIAKEILGDEYSLKIIESVLYSTDNAKLRQRPHVDLPARLGEKGVLAFVCLQAGTRIIIFRGTHKDLGSIGTENFPRLYQLNVGDILFFHPNLIHAGDRYTRANIRVHYYVLPKRCNWKTDTTYSPELMVTDKLNVILPRVRQVEHRAKSCQASCKVKTTRKRNRAKAGLNNLDTWRAIKKKEKAAEERKQQRKRPRK